jgi:SAM-dependent methyltransferase
MLYERIKQVVCKIVKKNQIQSPIIQIILNTSLSEKEKIIQISGILRSLPFIRKKQDKSFIVSRLSAFLKKYCLVKYPIIADIGGGNGLIVRDIGKTIHLPKENLYCIEPLQPWCEPYPFSYQQEIQYIFWDNERIPVVKDHSLDIVLMIVSLHHMTKETMSNLLNNLSRLCKLGSIVIIKEHNCMTEEDRYVIDWEHHLYHITTHPIFDESGYQQYKESICHQFQRKTEIDTQMEQRGFESLLELNRLFEVTEDKNNPTNLYWKIYKYVKN